MRRSSPSTNCRYRPLAMFIAVLRAELTAKLFDDFVLVPSLATVKRTEIEVGVHLIINGLVEGGEEDVDVFVVGARAHHSGEVDVLFGVPFNDGSHGARRQVVLVFDDVDAAFQGVGITRNDDNTVFAIAGSATETGLSVFDLAS